VDFALDTDQEAIREAIAKICARFDDDYWLTRDREGGFPLDFHAAFAKDGWLGICMPEEFGGSALGVTEAAIMMQAISESGAGQSGASAVHMNIFGLNPVVVFGTEAQKRRFLPRAANLDDWWCQGFSEPGAGSDLASLRTTARRDGDCYVVDGQKTWTTLAQYADWMFCLVRTGREAKRQQGISFLLIDMKTPGVEVQPIRMMDGRHYLNAVFFDNAKVPKRNRIGEEGRGWTYAKFLLEHERVENANLRFITQELQKLRRVASEVRSDGRRLADDPSFMADVSAVEAQFKALEIGLLRTLSDMHAGAPAGPGKSSFIKIRGTEIAQRITELLVQASGPDALRYQPGPLFGHNDDALIGPAHALGPVATYLFCRAMTIYGGSTEVQKNIMAKHALGL